MKKMEFDKLRKNKKFMALFIFGIVFLSTSVLAVWYMSYNADTGYVISSSVPITFSDSFTIGSITSGNLTISKTESITLSNSDGDLPFNVSLITTRDDASDGCTDYINDANITANYDGNLISHGSDINVSNGNTLLNITTSIKPFSCEGNVTTEIILIPQ